jgi:hypothetical protein
MIKRQMADSEVLTGHAARDMPTINEKIIGV